MRSSGKNLENPVFSHALICAEVVVNGDVIFVRFIGIYVQFLHLHICHILNLLDVTSIAIYSLFNYQNCNKFVKFNVQTLEHLSPQPGCALTYNQSHSVTQL
jgi:hypothetical protein